MLDHILGTNIFLRAVILHLCCYCVHVPSDAIQTDQREWTFIYSRLKMSKVYTYIGLSQKQLVKTDDLSLLNYMVVLISIQK